LSAWSREIAAVFDSLSAWSREIAAVFAASSRLSFEIAADCAATEASRELSKSDTDESCDSAEARRDPRYRISADCSEMKLEWKDKRRDCWQREATVEFSASVDLIVL
jgi:hypothetical protein